MDFNSIQLEDQKAYLACFEKCPQKSSDYSFTNLYGWSEEYGLSWSFTGGLFWIKQTYPREVLWAPVGPWEKVDWYLLFESYFKMNIEFFRVPEKLTNIWNGQFNNRMNIDEDRGAWDYLYSAESLSELKGNRYHKKKNLVNQFKKKYDFSYRPFEKSLVDGALDMQENWCTWRDCESSEILAAENRVIGKILKNWNRLNGLVGGALFVDSQMVAYTIGEKMGDGTLLIHFEKGNQEYKGVYQAMNQMFVENLISDDAYRSIEMVNREQDLDNEGLRKAKLSYHPVEFLKKYTVKIR